MSDPRNPNINNRTTPQYALYQRDNLLKGREGDVPIFNTGGYLYLAVTR